MTTDQEIALRRVAEGFRQRATNIEARQNKSVWVQNLNVIAALEGCAEDLEDFLREQCPAPPPPPSTASCPLEPAPAANPS